MLVSINSLVYAGLIKPAEGQELNYVYVLFEWDQETDALGYNIQLSTVENFSYLSLDDSVESTVYIAENIINWNTEYFWRVRQFNSNGTLGNWIDTASFFIAGSDFDNISTSIIYPDSMQVGLTVFGDVWGFRSGMIDADGNEVWHDNNSTIMMNHINEYGQMFGFGIFDYPNNTGIEFNRDIDLIWNGPQGVAIDIHEIKQIPNGNYMGFVRVDTMAFIPDDNDMTFLFQALGYTADGVTAEFPWYGYALVEFDRETSEPVWVWNPFDYFTLEDFDNIGNTWFNAYLSQEYDWMHSNAFFFDEVESAVYMSHRHLSRITKIAYPSGEVNWNMGLPEPYMASGDEHICTELLFSFQHNIQLLENGHYLFFDNGNLSETLFGYNQPISRALEVEIIGDSICNLIWEYSLDEDQYSPGMGSVQLLENGNYLISSIGDGGTILEVNPAKEIIWEAHLGLNYPVGNSYRSYRIPSLHPSAFSVIMDGYHEIELDDGPANVITLSVWDENLSFTIYNESGYTQPFAYSIYDDHGWLDETNAVITVEPFDHAEISIPAAINSEISQLTLIVKPVHHPYDLKELNFTLFDTGLSTKNEDINLPKTFALNQNYPNPFNPITSIGYDLPENAMVEITVYDISGRNIITLLHEFQKAGSKMIAWNGTNDLGEKVPSGIYLLTLQAGNFLQTKKCLVLK